MWFSVKNFTEKLISCQLDLGRFLFSMVWYLRWPLHTFSRPWWPSQPFSHTRPSSIDDRQKIIFYKRQAVGVRIDPIFEPLKWENSLNFSVKFFSENHFFSSPAMSNLQAISLYFQNFLHGFFLSMDQITEVPNCSNFESTVGAYFLKDKNILTLRAEIWKFLSHWGT